MAEQGMTEAEAFRWIQRTAMNQRTSMKALAETILTPGTADEGTRLSVLRPTPASRVSSR